MQAHAATSLLQSLLGGSWTLQALDASAFCGTWQARQGHTQLFVKTAHAASAAMLAAEAEAVRVPAVLVESSNEEGALLAMEWLTLRAPDADFGQRLGRALAHLHAASSPLPNGYGWTRDNFIGATPQSNTRCGQWPEFFAQQRLGAMLQGLRARGCPTGLDDAICQVMEAVPRFFDDGHAPRPSLVHGDLWSGNWGMLEEGTPVIYDPAVSCSDAEAELAMMELFGAPPPGFWTAYEAAAGLHPGYAARRPLYQLYHLLNHALLFGGGYLQQSLRLARRLIAAR
jgi:protein-ribulosamine 3-kinase